RDSRSLTARRNPAAGCFTGPRLSWPEPAHSTDVLRQGGWRLVERLLLIALGGAIGTALRYLTALAAARWLGTEFPYGTLIVNLVGSFLIGLVQQLAMDALISETTRLFVTAGMMGGLTTYSAFSDRTVQLIAL